MRFAYPYVVGPIPIIMTQPILFLHGKRKYILAAARERRRNLDFRLILTGR